MQQQSHQEKWKILFLLFYEKVKKVRFLDFFFNFF